ncbi:hypothetical protein TRICI_006868 [Trichomonascus ciferrii]|uniref:Cell wall protein n=1 Tax=Trichomonascus ciferrii TaxID=44093 RepID=A0A642UER0_9ASCO|nr:hypothetical protein TRICI_006868 [Trichomonascus ciferrii]
MKLAAISSLLLAAVPGFAQTMAGPGAGAGAGNGNGTGAGLNKNVTSDLPSSVLPSQGSANTPSPGTNKSSQFGLVTLRSGTPEVHQKTVYVYDDGTLGISDEGDEFAGHLSVGPNIIYNVDSNPNENIVLTITEDHTLAFDKIEDLADATQDWTTNQYLTWNGQEYAMVCPNDDNKIIWADENAGCEGGIGVQLRVVSQAA